MAFTTYRNHEGSLTCESYEIHAQKADLSEDDRDIYQGDAAKGWLSDRAGTALDYIEWCRDFGRGTWIGLSFQHGLATGQHWLRSTAVAWEEVLLLHRVLNMSRNRGICVVEHYTLYCGPVLSTHSHFIIVASVHL